MRAVLINGIGNSWGIALARRLRARSDLRLIGIDRCVPNELVEGVEVLTQALRGQQIAELIERERVAVVVQLALYGELAQVESEEAKQVNVLGTMELLGACLRAGAEQVIIRSSTLVYGPNPNNPAFLAERWPLAGKLRTPWLRDCVEIETLAQSFRKRHSRPAITTLRFPAVLGGGVTTAFGSFLTQPAVLRPPGFDPRIQVLHGDDALAAIEQAIDQPLAGPINIAADPPLPLSRAIRLAAASERSALGTFAQLIAAAQAARTAGRFDPDYLRYSCVSDTARMHSEFNFTPSHSSEATLADCTVGEQAQHS